jgi:putative membrane protein
VDAGTLGIASEEHAAIVSGESSATSPMRPIARGRIVGAVPTNDPRRYRAMTKQRLTLISGLVLAAFAAVSLSFILDEEVVAAKGALVTLLPLTFALVHGAINYRFRDVLVFVAVTFVVSNAFENLSIATGFPFGDYYYTDALGPKLFEVPLLVGPAYIATGYLAWTLARVILGATRQSLPGALTYTVPLLAGFIMVSWDLAMDPITATIQQQWIWEDGGGYFGVPFSNFLGWYLTVWVFFQLFALYMRKRDGVYAGAQPESRGYWLQAVLCYAVVAMKFPLNILVETGNSIIADPVGVTWRTSDIYLTCGLIAIFTMFAFVAVSGIRVFQLPAAVRVKREVRAPAVVAGEA